MMKLSHESKVRLGVGIGAFVLIIVGLSLALRGYWLILIWCVRPVFYLAICLILTICLTRTIP